MPLPSVKFLFALLLAWLVALPAPVLAQEVRQEGGRVSLEEVLTIGRNNNPRILGIKEYVKEQNLALLQQRLSATPRLDASGYIGYYIQHQNQIVPNFITIFGQRLQLGTRAGTNTTAGSIGSVTLTATQPLATFGRLEASRAISEHNYQLALWAQKQTLYDAGQQIINHYLNCYSEGVNRRIREEYVDSTKKILDIVKKRYDLRADTVANLRLVTIEYRNQNNNLKLQLESERNSCQLLLRAIKAEGFPKAEELSGFLTRIEAENYDALIPASLAELTGLLRRYNPQLQQSKENYLVSKENRNAVVAQLFPTSSATASLQQTFTPPTTTDNQLVSNGVISVQQRIQVNLSYNQNPVQSIFNAKQAGQNLLAASYDTKVAFVTSDNLANQLWQRYQAAQSSLPLMADSIKEWQGVVAGAERQYQLQAISLRQYLEARRQLLSSLLNYQNIYSRRVAATLAIMLFLEGGI